MMARAASTKTSLTLAQCIAMPEVFLKLVLIVTDCFASGSQLTFDLAAEAILPAGDHGQAQRQGQKCRLESRSSLGKQVQEGKHLMLGKAGTDVEPARGFKLFRRGLGTPAGCHAPKPPVHDRPQARPHQYGGDQRPQYLSPDGMVTPGTTLALRESSRPSKLAHGICRQNWQTETSQHKEGRQLC